MSPRLRRLGIALLVVMGVAAALVIATRQTLVLDPPDPQIRSDLPDSFPTQALSIVEAPVTYDLATAIDSLEAAVPRTYGDLDNRIPTAKNKNLSYAFHLRRSRFRVKVVGQTVTISADVAYAGRAWYKPPIGPEIEVACGTGTSPPRRATLTLESTAELTPEWGLRTRSKVVRLAAYSDSARDRCRLTFLRIDVTERVLASTREALDATLVRFDDAVARWPVRRRFEKIWRDLQKPLTLADSVYMTIRPTAAELGAVGERQGIAYANLRLLAAPRITSGPRPEVTHTALPPLRRARDVGRGAWVLIDASIRYPVATAMLKKALVGRHIESGRHRVRIRDVKLFGIGGGQVALGVWISGDVRGRVFFTGTPWFDPSERTITVPDLAYDVGTARILVAGYEWLRDVRVRDFLREKARIQDSTVVGPLARLAEHGINRDLPARGTRLSGRIAQAGVVGVRATRADLHVRAVADADLTLSINRAPSIPRPPRSPVRSEETSRTPPRTRGPRRGGRASATAGGG